jgi:similar to spore coat protein
MTHQCIAPHESIQLHEILTFKNLCLTKAISMAILVSDEELKSILKQDATLGEKQIKELKTLMEEANTDLNKLPNIK